MTPEVPEIEELHQAAAWRLRLKDADPDDEPSSAAARLLEELADDLRQKAYTAEWRELRSICNWLAESDAISDYADLAMDYRVKIGVSEHPRDGGDYLRGLLAIARGLV